MVAACTVCRLYAPLQPVQKERLDFFTSQATALFYLHHLLLHYPHLEAPEYKKRDNL